MGRALPGRQQRRPHRRAADGRELRAAPDPVGHPHARRHERDRQRRRRRPGRAARRAEGPRGSRRRHRAAADLRRRAPADALPRRHRQGRRALRGQQEDRHHRPRHRPVLPGQDRPHRHPRRRRARRGAAGRKDRGRTGIQEPGAGQDLQPQGAGCPTRWSTNLLDAGRGLQAPHRRHPAAAQRRARQGRDGAAGGLAGHAARRRPRHVSLCHVVEPDRRRRGRRLGHRPDPHHHGAGHPQGVHHPRRLGSVPHRVVRRDTASTCPRPAASSA